MVETNISCNGKDNIIKSIFWILSVLSWLLLIILEIISFSYLNSKYTVWTFYRIPIYHGCADNWMCFYPITMRAPFLYIVFIILLCFTIVAFIFYMIKSTCNKEGKIFEAMNGEWTKFHFVPLLFACFLFLISETIGDTRHDERMNIWGMVFVILGLISLIFIYIKTNLPADWFAATIKKGTYSCLISLEWYYFFYDICNLRINKGVDFDAISLCSGLFSVLIGIGGLAFAIYFKDVVVAVMFFLIYLGCTIFFFSINSKVREGFNKYFDGIVDIFMMILFLIETGFIIIKYKMEVLS